MAVSPSIKYSRQREMILNHVKNFPVHPTADEVYTALKKDNPELSLGTVYRNLNLLCELGMLKKIHIDNAKERYDVRTDRHSHLLCTVCNRVFDITDEALDGIEKRISEKYGYIVEDVSLNVKGKCAECAKLEKSEIAGNNDE